MSLASKQTGSNQSNAHSGKTNILPDSQVKKSSHQQSNNMHMKQSDRSRARGTSNRSNSSFALMTERVFQPKKIALQATTAHSSEEVKIALNFTEPIGKGTFGQIERATLNVVRDEKEAIKSSSDNDEKPLRPGEGSSLQVAVKRVLQDPRYKNRELGIMQKLGNHPNIVRFYYFYYSSNSQSGHQTTGSINPALTESGSGVNVYLHLILECFPGSLCDLIYQYSQCSKTIPILTVKLFTYQMLKALAYLHSHRICHRDIKSSNLLVNESTLVLKVCDFGSAKEMSPGTPNVSYISSRYYRAPELLFGAQSYSCAIDTWSAGCVLAEMLRQNCLFTGSDSVDQLVKVIRVLGTPTTDDIASMNPVYETYSFPDVRSCPVKLFFPHGTPNDLLTLMCRMLKYNPSKRIAPKLALNEPCFDDLVKIGPDGTVGPNAVPMPPHLFESNPPSPPNEAAAAKKPSTGAATVDRDAKDAKPAAASSSNENPAKREDGGEDVAGAGGGAIAAEADQKTAEGQPASDKT